MSDNTLVTVPGDGYRLNLITLIMEMSPELLEELHLFVLKRYAINGIPAPYDHGRLDSINASIEAFVT